jgi:hypothetical protein
MNRKKRLDFHPGDRVLLRLDADEIRTNFKFLPKMAEWKGKLMTVGEIFLTSEGEPACSVRESYYYWPLKWLKFVRKSRGEVTKLKPGDWIILKDEIDSADAANNIALYGFKHEMMKWKNKFMKVMEVHITPAGNIYYVKENDCHWHEDWMEKVE